MNGLRTLRRTRLDPAALRAQDAVIGQWPVTDCEIDSLSSGSAHALGEQIRLNVYHPTETAADGDRKIIYQVFMEGGSIRLSSHHIVVEGFVEVNVDGSDHRRFGDEPTGLYQRERWFVG